MDVVLFDLDGTLVDSVPGLTVALAALLRERGRVPVPDAAVRSYIGHGAAHLLARAAADTGGPFQAPALDRYVALCAELATERTQPYPGIPALLDALPARRGLVTNKPHDATVALLRHLGWTDGFEVVVSGDSLPTRKPAPGPLLYAMNAMGAQPADTVYVGDSEVDEEAAGRAGVAFVGVAWGYGTPGRPVADVGGLGRRLARD